MKIVSIKPATFKNPGWLQERFGECVAQISVDTTLKLKSAVLDCARFTLGEVPPDIAELTKDFELPPQGLEDYKFVFGYEDSGSWVKGSIEYDEALKTYVARYPEQWKIVQKALGLARQKGRHACAFLIANDPVPELGIPLTKISDVTCTQFTAPSVEAVGGLKMDFLVINSLNDIAQAIKYCQERGMKPPADGLVLNGKYVPALRLIPRPDAMKNLIEQQDLKPEEMFVDVWDLPEDQAVFADVSTGKTETVFQFNTPGAVQLLHHFASKGPNGNYAIDSIEDMAAFTALDRPGPLDAYVQNPDQERCATCKNGKDAAGEPCTHGRHNMLVEYARRARGARPSPDIFPIFDKLFPETHGVMVYQEQLQRLYQEVTGCSGAEAEEFRSNVAKKKKEKIIEAYPKFIEGATKQMGSKESAEAVWATIQSWAAYGFNKSHAVCYCVIAYACAWLKHHYPLEWWCAVLRNAKKDEISEKFWKHCGHLIDLPDVTKAAPNFELVGDRIQAPLGLLHGVGEAAQVELVSGAPYASLRDYLQKIEARKAAGTHPGKGKKKVKEVDPQTGEIVEKTIEVDKVVKGRSSLNSGINYKLMVSGAMDGLFPPGTTTLDMLHGYERTRWEMENEARAALPKPKRPKKAPDPVKPEYVNLTQYTRYQLRKQLLPAYSESVLKMLVERRHPTVHHNGRRHTYDWERKPLVLANPSDIARVNSAARLPEGGQFLAVAAYVEKTKVFRYGERKDKQAFKATFDVDGEKFEWVRWPDRETGELDPRFTVKLKDALVILVLGKFRETRPFVIEDIEVVQHAPGEDSESEEESETENKETI